MNASIDESGVRTLLGTLESDGKTPIKVLGNPTNGSVKCIDDTTGTNLGDAVASRDANNTPVMMLTSYVDGVTMFPAAVDINGNLLIQSI